MKRLIILSFVLTVALSLTVSAQTPSYTAQLVESVVRQESVSAEDFGFAAPKVLPGSTWYFLKDISRGIQSFFTFNSVKKAELELHFADERLMEAKALVEKSPENTVALQKSIDAYQEKVEILGTRLEGLKETSQNPNVDKLLEKAMDRAIRHEKLFDELIAKSAEIAPTSASAIGEIMAPVQGKIFDVISVVIPQKFESPAEFGKRLQKATESQEQNFAAPIRMVEVLDRLEAKAPAEIKSQIYAARSGLLDKAAVAIENITLQSPTEASQAVSEVLKVLPGDQAVRGKILTEIETKITEEKVISPSAGTAAREFIDDVKKDISRDKALGAIKRAEEKINELRANFALASFPSPLPSGVFDLNETGVRAFNLLRVADERLTYAKAAFEQGKFSETYSQATEAEAIARKGLTLLSSIKRDGQVQVISPNGGETCYIGSPCKISWTYNAISPANAWLTLHLMKDGREVYNPLTAALSTIDYGYYDWTIRSDINNSDITSGGNFKIRAKIYDATTGYVFASDESDSYFKIVSPATTTISSITVLSPNGGEKWKVGETHRISWNSTGVQSVKLYLYDERISSGSGQIVGYPAGFDPIPNQGYYDWLIPLFSQINDGKNLKIGVSDANSHVMDTSDTPFSVEFPPTQPITVLSPNGGETWEIGKTYTIRWHASSDLSKTLRYINAVYVPSGGALAVERSLNVLGDGYYNWTIPKDWPMTGEFKIRVGVQAGSIYDDSDSYFKIVSPTTTNKPPVITGVGGPTNLKANETGTWTVTAYDPDGTYLSYNVDWGDDSGVISPTPKRSSSVNTSQTATFTHIYSQAGDYTAVFTVSDDKGASAKTSVSVNVGGVVPHNTSPKITLAPVVPSSVALNKLVNFSVAATDADNDDLVWSVSWGDGTSASGACSTNPNPQQKKGWSYNTSHGWNSPGTYVVKFTVSDCRGGSASMDFGVNVAVVSPPHQSITVLSPNGGEVWQKGETYQISWESYGLQSADKIFIDLVQPIQTIGSGDGMRSVHRIADGIEDSGRLLWTIPASIPTTSNQGTSSYKIRIQRTGGDIGDMSDNYFFIASSASTPTSTPSITVLSPNGGEKWTAGSTQQIKWSSSNLSSTQKLYVDLVEPTNTTSGGWFVKSVYQIASGISASQGYFNWTVPTSIQSSSNYKIRVMTSDDVGDVSDSVFSIVSHNTSPKITLAPVVPSSVALNKLVNFSVAATDADNDDLVWSVSWGDGTSASGACSTNPNPQQKKGWSYNTSHGWNSPGTYVVKFTVSDCRGGSASMDFGVNVVMFL